MQIGLEQEHRAFYRIQVEVPVRFRFLQEPQGETAGQLSQEWQDGVTRNLSSGGLLLEGAIPSVGLLEHLLSGRIHVAVEIRLPDGEPPIAAVSRIAWLEGLESSNLSCRFGLRFLEIPRVQEDRLASFVVHHLLPA